MDPPGIIAGDHETTIWRKRGASEAIIAVKRADRGAHTQIPKLERFVFRA